MPNTKAPTQDVKPVLTITLDKLGYDYLSIHTFTCSKLWDGFAVVIVKGFNDA